MAYNSEVSCEGWSGRTEETKERALYNIEGSGFEHTEINEERFGVLYFGSKLNLPGDEAVCKLAEPTLGEYFADKLCDMAINAGFDAVVLRDSVFTPAYRRGNKNRYMNPEEMGAMG